MAKIHHMQSEAKVQAETLSTVRGAINDLRQQLEDSNKDWIDVKTAARYLSCTVETIRGYIDTGMLDASQLVPKGKWRITRASVEEALHRGRMS